MRVTQWFEDLASDMTYAGRQLTAAPAFTIVAALTLALGIGANSAIFALVDATLLRPLPFGDPGRLVAIWETSHATPRGFVSPLNMLDWNARSRTFEKIAGFTPSIGGMVTEGADGNAETVSRQWVTAGIFDVLGVRPLLGRTFSPDDEQKRANVVVMSETLWRARYNADPTIVGRAIRFDGDPWTVIGIVPKEVQLLGPTGIWAMRPLVNLPPRVRAAYALQVVGRLKPGVSVQAAGADLAAVAEGLAREFPQTNTGRSVALETLHASMIGTDMRTTSLLFLGVVGFVLLICCANVANLLLARATVRRREFAVRSALGAGRRRIVRQLLTESVVLSVIGAALGLAVGAFILEAAPALIPEGLLPPTVTLTFDMRVVGFCAAAALLVGLLFGVMPALTATDFSLAEALGADGRTIAGGGGTIRRLLVMGQVALAVLLLFGAGLLLRTLMAVEAYDPGYRAESVLSMLVDPLGSKYPTPESLQQFFDTVEAEVRAVPGVRDVAWASGVPLGESLFGEYPFTYEIAGDPLPADGERPTTELQVVSPAYFSTLDLPIVAGRAFDERDRRGGARVCIVNEAFARRFGGRSLIGQQIAIKPVEAPPQAKPTMGEIVGIARQVKRRPDERADFVQIYVPMAQNLSDDIIMLVRPQSGRAELVTPAVRAAISRVDTAQLVSIRDIDTLEDVAWRATARHRFRATMVLAFAALALVLAMVGVFGILAYSVQQQVRDFGVRRALGATTNDVLRHVLSNGARVVAIGAAAGLVLSALFGRLIVSMLFGVEPLDPVTLAAVAAVLAITAGLSIAGPAWRAARIEPAAALRSK
jgi:putative ABC transport system permease protein